MNDEIVTVAEMECRYKGEWVLLTEPVLGEDHRVLSGKIVAHGPDRDEVYDAGLQIPPPRHLATLCFKEREEGTAVAF
jgi:hypothetical protein